MSEKKYSKAEWAAMMKAQRKELHEKSDREAMEIARDQDRFLSFLDLYCRLNYTFNNALLIHAERPNATAIKDFASWREAGNPVMNNEKGIQINEPNGTYIRKDGSVGTNYKVKTVFDVSQTKAGATEKTPYNLKDVRDSLIFGEEEFFEGRNLADCIDICCEKNGEKNEDFIIACAKYLLKKRYGVIPNVFDQDAVDFFKNTTTGIGVKTALHEIDNIYREIMKKIDRGLYIKEQEALNNDEQR